MMRMCFSGSTCSTSLGLADTTDHLHRTSSFLRGCRAHAVVAICAINFARRSGLTYVHTPFTNIAHADRPMSEWVAVWETHFNVGAGEEIACYRNRHEVVSYWSNQLLLELCFGWRGREDELDRGLIAMIPEIRRKYYLNKTPRLTDDAAVAIHVRRGDVSAGDSRFSSTDAVLRTATLVKSVLDGSSASYRIGVYSQGDHHDFEDFSLQLGAELFLDADATWTMRELIEADILIMAKGFFSAYASLISDGIKIADLTTSITRVKE